MAGSDDNSQSFQKSDERYKYIGFEVFPGKPGNIFKSDEERKSLIEKVMRKLTRSEGEVRDRCTLMEDRISSLEKTFMTIVAVAMVLSLFLPWFSGYHETVTTRYEAIQETAAVGEEAAENAAVTDSLAASAALEETPGEVAEATEAVEEVPATAGMADVTGEVTEGAGEGEMADAAATEAPPLNSRTVTEVNREYKRLSGFGALFSIGSYGSLVFSSGFVLAVSGILMIAFILSCIVMAALNLYVIYGAKKSNPETQVLYTKKMLRYNWIPIFIFFGILILSFIGADYGFDPSGMIKQVGRSYSLMTFIDMTFGQMSYGFLLAFMSFWVLALKGKEI